MTTDEQALVSKAISYLKRTYGEDTVSMDVKADTVKDGPGVLSVDCTVSVDGVESDWSKEFYFQNKAVTRMNWLRR